MSILHINQIKAYVLKTFREHIDISDIQDQENAIVSRCLAAYAIYCSTDCTTEEAAQAVVDGNDDNGIDAIYYNELQKELVLVQAKWREDGKKTLASADMIKFCGGVKDLFNFEMDRFNKKFISKQSNITKALNEYSANYKLVLIDTSESATLSEHAERAKNDLLRELNYSGDTDAPDKINFTYINQAYAHRLISRQTENPITLELALMNWGTISTPYTGYVGALSGEDAANWWKTYNTRLFSKNIRNTLGNTEVNEEMLKTLIKQPELFWYFNNGITIITNNIESSKIGGTSRDLRILKLTGAAIVNGAQTISTLGKFAENILETNKDDIGKVKILVKIIQISDTEPDFADHVTKNTNRQNRVENRDFASQDPEQKRLRNELSIEEIDYQIKRSDEFKPSDTSFDILEATVALACASGNTPFAVQVKGGIGKIFETLDKGIYKELFNQNTTAWYLSNAVKFSRIVEAELKKRVSNIGTKSGRQYGILVHGNRIITLILKQTISLNLTEKEIILDPEIISSTTEKTILEITNFLDKEHPDCLLASFFKNTTKCVQLVKSICK